MRIRFAGVVVAAWYLLGVAASAHHGFNVEFDGTKCMDLKGTLTGVIWENPHAYLQMDVKDAAEYIKLSDGILRIVGQIPERGMTPDKLNF
jgi:hypothetical protein